MLLQKESTQVTLQSAQADRTFFGGGIWQIVSMSLYRHDSVSCYTKMAFIDTLDSEFNKITRIRI